MEQIYTEYDINEYNFPNIFLTKPVWIEIAGIITSFTMHDNKWSLQAEIDLVVLFVLRRGNLNGGKLAKRTYFCVTCSVQI